MEQKLTPENCGCSRTACEIVNETFLALDGFKALRRECDDSSYKAIQFAGSLARITDRVLKEQAGTDPERLQWGQQLGLPHPFDI